MLGESGILQTGFVIVLVVFVVCFLPLLLLLFFVFFLFPLPVGLSPCGSTSSIVRTFRSIYIIVLRHVAGSSGITAIVTGEVCRKII